MEPVQSHILSEDMSANLFWCAAHEKYRVHEPTSVQKILLFAVLGVTV